MYAYLKGTLEEIAEDAVVVEVGNIGYKVRVSATTTQGLPGLAARLRFIPIRWCVRTHLHCMGF